MPLGTTKSKKVKMPLDKKNTPEKSSLLQQWRNRKNAKKEITQISPMPTGEVAEPSNGQQRLWLLQQLYPQNPFYQYGHLYKIEGTFDFEIFEKSVQTLLNRHQILRTNFVKRDAQLILKSQSTETFKIELTDFSKTHANTFAKKENEAFDFIKKEISKPYNLANDFLIRINVIQFSENSFWIILGMHHIIGDRLSLLLLNEELFEIYANLEQDKKNALPPLPIQYQDYTFWKKQQKTNEKNLDFWLKKLSGELPILDLPHDFSRPKNPTFRGKTIAKKLSPNLTSQLKVLAQQQQTTLYVIILAVFKVLLYRYSNQTDILVGSPINNREKLELEKLIGFFNETIVLRSQLEEEQSFENLVQQLKTTVSQAFEHKDTPYEELVRALQPERHGSNNPIFQTMFLYNNINTNSYQDLNFEIQEESIDLGVSKFDLTLFANDHSQQLELALEFSLDLFEEGTAQRMLQHLEVILNSVVQNPNQFISKISLLKKEEINEMLVEWNKTEMDLPNHSAVHYLIEEMAKKFPKQKAVIFQNDELTYQQLNEQANTIAKKLIKNGVQPNSPVGLFTGRSVEMIIGILGILKAGAAYLPLDPEYPFERVKFMLNDSGAQFILTQKKLKSQLKKFNIKIITLDAVDESNLENIVLSNTNSNNLAYLIYTSGSTGVPKGVPISHQNLIHSTAARFSFYPSNPDCFLLLSSFSFDSSVVGIFWTLCSGGTLLIPQKRIEQDVQQLGNLIEKHRVTHTLMLPSLYGTILQYISTEQLFSLKNVMVAGEACPQKLLNLHFKSLPHVELYNEYGPTEASVWCIAHRIQKEDTAFVPIGKAIPNATVFILNKKLEPVPIGVGGELYIGGLGLTDGYLNRPELTAQKFLEFSFLEHKKQRIYKTGDLARFHSNGQIEFLGRVDQQVKIRGFRIELEEIQNTILQIEGIRECIVIISKNDSDPDKTSTTKKIIAYISGLSEKQITPLRTYLKNKLPEYMIPAAFIPLEEFPRLPNGKINRKALPLPSDILADQNNFVAPKTEMEKQLVSIWESVLGINDIGINDNYFEIGGDSIGSIQVIAKAKAIGINLAPHHLFEYQTIADLSNFLQKEKQQNATIKAEETISKSIVLLNKDGKRPPIFCVHSGGGHVFFYQPLAQKLDNDQPLYALQPKGVHGKSKIQNSIKEMASFYIQEMKKVQPSGPYHLLGTCFSNAVVLEMAHQLVEVKETIGALVFVDSAPLHLVGNDTNGNSKTLSRFFDLVKRGDFQQIQKKLSTRFFPSKRKKLVLDIKDKKSEEQLKSTISKLNKIYADYDWKPYEGAIHFIRSSEFSNRSDKKYHVTQWKKLADGDLKIHIVDGHHLTLFEAPEVDGLSKCIEIILRKE